MHIHDIEIDEINHHHHEISREHTRHQYARAGNDLSFRHALCDKRWDMLSATNVKRMTRDVRKM